MSYLCISCVTLDTGGAERVISILANRFVSQFDYVSIYMWQGSKIFYDFDRKIRIVSIDDKAGTENPIKKMLWFRKEMQNQVPDIILSFLAKSSIQVILATRSMNIPVIVAERNDPHCLRGGKPMIMIRDFLYRYATGILQQTENNKNYFKDTKRDKTTVIYNPVFLDEKYVGKALSTTKEKLIVSVGRLEPQKNFPLLISAFAKFHKTHPDYKLAIYGKGKEHGRLMKLAERLGIRNAVDLPGAVSNVIEAICPAKVFVLPSNFEGMSNALIEAMCLGLPCISTRVSGSTELIKDNVNGKLIGIGDEAMLVHSLVQLIEDEEESTRMAVEAVKLYEKLNIDRICQQWSDYLMSHLKI